ncbi:ABC-type thiamin-related transport system, permease component 1, predicted [Thermaerobacter marianensis DSM 12885]|uniref:ABC-type thiamin-related transport system, permease component 1, predicted n=1 Tax=Thermaerobacter marianensis (strain ATCC 700841 / DSM 12885 / JCM 10246 / 7p75a) TaxID=644966 RepID=E6SM81_THEM7|nr:ECF transporter S component [Thermaerobacter marianensis]ADU51440.1 ABC-type thiamin-related transport system, permease component 1, predicted [Thermaerobacter marianensis DSM 12885]
MAGSSRRLQFREIVMLAFIAAVCSVVFINNWTLWNLAQAVHPVLAETVYGIWFIASTVAAYIIRKPGVAFVAELVAAAGELLLGSPDVLWVLLYGGLQGLGAEAAFALLRYRRFDLPALALAGGLAAVASIPLDAITGYFTGMQAGVLAAAVAVRLVSGAVVAGLFAKILVDGLAKTGVLNAYAVVRERQDRPAGLAG